MKNDYRTHRAPYYGGQRFARTLDEAFGPYTSHVIHPTERPHWLHRVAPYLVIVASVALVVLAVMGPYQ